jgi:hypothetical protein
MAGFAGAEVVAGPASLTIRVVHGFCTHDAGNESLFLGAPLLCLSVTGVVFQFRFSSKDSVSIRAEHSESKN